MYNSEGIPSITLYTQVQKCIHAYCTVFSIAQQEIVEGSTITVNRLSVKLCAHTSWYPRVHPQILNPKNVAKFPTTC